MYRLSCVPVMLLVLVAFGVFTIPASAQPTTATKRAITAAYTEFRSGLRHEDGKLACSRMTLSFRRKLLKIFADEGAAGLGCVRLIEIAGREIYNSVRTQGRKLTRISLVSSTRARAHTDTGGSACFHRDKGRWKLHSGGKPRRLCKL